MSAYPSGETPLIKFVFRELDVMTPALKFPEASRFTIALAVSVLVGATVQARLSVPFVVSGEPLTVKSEEGAARATLVTLPPLLLSAAQAQAEPFHFKIWLAVQVLRSFRFKVRRFRRPSGRCLRQWLRR